MNIKKLNEELRKMTIKESESNCFKLAYWQDIIDLNPELDVEINKLNSYQVDITLESKYSDKDILTFKYMDENIDTDVGIESISIYIDGYNKGKTYKPYFTYSANVLVGGQGYYNLPDGGIDCPESIKASFRDEFPEPDKLIDDIVKELDKHSGMFTLIKYMGKSIKN